MNYKKIKSLLNAKDNASKNIALQILIGEKIKGELLELAKLDYMSFVVIDIGDDFEVFLSDEMTPNVSIPFNVSEETTVDIYTNMVVNRELIKLAKDCFFFWPVEFYAKIWLKSLQFNALSGYYIIELTDFEHKANRVNLNDLPDLSVRNCYG